MHPNRKSKMGGRVYEYLHARLSGFVADPGGGHIPCWT